MMKKEKRYNLVLCDDDVMFLELLEEKISEQMQKNGAACQVKRYPDSRQMLDHLTEEDELYVLDIDMPEVSGMELAKALLEKNPKASILFISNHEEMVFEAIRYQPFRFIRKEHLEEELPEAVNAWLEKKKRENSTIEITAKSGNVLLFLTDILYMESNRHYLMIHCGEQVYEVRGKISDYEKLLKGHGFVRVNVAYLVNCQYIRALRAKKVTLTNGMELNIGQNRQEEIKHTYMEYIREKALWKQ